VKAGEASPGETDRGDWAAGSRPPIASVDLGQA